LLDVRLSEYPKMLRRNGWPLPATDGAPTQIT
jgi:hypothetical protein